MLQSSFRKLQTVRKNGVRAKREVPGPLLEWSSFPLPAGGEAPRLSHNRRGRGLGTAWRRSITTRIRLCFPDVLTRDSFDSAGIYPLADI